MSIFYYLRGDEVIARPVPSPEVEVLPRVTWGRPEVLFTPAYWMTQQWVLEGPIREHHRLGETFEEEVVACLLGGHGIPSEVGLAAFERMRDTGLIAERCCDAEILSEHLHEPLVIGNRRIIYRFWRQKARYVASAIRALSAEPLPSQSPRTLRDHLMRFPGIGPKTASWVVRNWLNSSEVAILDIHVVRAGRMMGLYSSSDRVHEHYLRMERQFLDLAGAIEVPAADLDALIWSQMRQSPRLVSRLLGALH
jgi:N-glycosylase/DNA lyase